jgi:sodium pump decarboxylase gamma subunit
VFCDWGRATFDSETLQDGLYLSLIGMGVVFVVLILLGLAVQAMGRFDAMYPAQADATGQQSADRSAPPVTSATDADAGTAAAIGVALALAESESSGGRRRGARQSGESTAAGSWMQSGRARLMSRQNIGRGRRR